MRYSLTALLASALLAVSASARFVIYADEWHPARPTNPEGRAGIDHVILAFAMANATATYQPKVPISTFRSEYPNAKVMIAVGGWGDDIGFFDVARTDASIQTFAADIATMLTNTGADGVDIDWEYPGGNGADYKQVPNSQKEWQIAAFPKVLAAIRSAIGDKILSIAVPGKKVDMIAYTRETGPQIWPSVDQINVMTYDLMNRRDNVTNHHSSVAGSEDTIRNYLAIGAPPEKMNLGFAYYAKYFTTQGDCGSMPLGCPIVLAEDPVTGQDLLTSGAWTFETSHMAPANTSTLPVSYDGTCGAEKGTKCASGCCSQYGNCGTSPEHCSGACQHAFGTGCTDADVAGSWQLAAQNGVTDEEAGGQYYFDAQNQLFWTWDTPELISRKFDEIVRKYGLGGVMAWSLGEDSYEWSHIRRMASEVANGVGYERSAIQDPIDNILSSDPSPSPTSASPYSIIFVDGTEQGPSTSSTQDPGSPPDYLVSYSPDSGTTPYIPTEAENTTEPIPDMAPSSSPTASLPTGIPTGALEEMPLQSWPPADAPPSDPDFIATTPIPPQNDDDILSPPADAPASDPDSIMFLPYPPINDDDWLSPPAEESSSDESSLGQLLADYLPLILDDWEASPDEGDVNPNWPSPPAPQSSSATQSSGQYYGHGEWPAQPTVEPPAVPEAWINDEEDESMEVGLSCRLVRRKKVVGKK